MLGGEKAPGMVLRGESGLFATFTPADNDVYPATPMAIIAKWRDLYRESSRRHAAGASFAKDPSGLQRPGYDPVLNAFFPAIDGDRPVLFQTESALEARRAVALSRELGFPLVLAGLKEGWEIAADLKKWNLPLFLSLDLPRDRKPEKPDSAKKDSTGLFPSDTVHATTPPPPDDNFVSDNRTFTYNDVLREHQRLENRQRDFRRLYYTSAAGLRGAAVRFGFSTAGATPGFLRENILALVREGLPEDAALAALTIDAARLLGLERSLGTVERGKIANLVATNGSYFDRRSTVRYTFVDGEMFEYTPGASALDTAVAAADTLKRDTASARRPFNFPPADARGNLLIRNATILTVTGGTLENSDLLVTNGRIAQIGSGLKAPSGVRVIEAKGKFVMPGIIDAHSHIAVSGPVNEWTNPVTAEVAIRDVLDPLDLSIYRALAGGVTISHVMHGSANVIGGQCQTIKHRYGTIDPEGIVMQGAPRTIKFALGENPTRVHGRGFGVQPSSRMGVESVLRNALTEAQRYMGAQKKYDRDRRSDPRAVAPAYSLRMETLAAILRGEILVNCHSYRADEILMVMRVFKEFGISKIVFQHANEGFKVAPELAAFGAGASVFSDWWAYKFEVYYSTAYNAAILTRNGVLTSINSDSPELVRHLYHEAAKTQRYGGLKPEEALALITINPARQLGIDSRVGSLEVGKDADIAIFSAHPLSIYAICEQTIVDGIVRFDRANDPDDMQLTIDPAVSVETATIDAGHEDRCMEGVR
jgi:imidazolonepropionase-like amidohydrolase